MTFDELWVEIEKLQVLPEAAIKQVPKILSNKTKKRLSRKTPKEVCWILNKAIDEINRGSIETVDALAQKELRNTKKTSLPHSVKRWKEE